MEWEEWEGMTKLQSAQRWVYSFEEVPLVIGDGLVSESAKMRHPILPLWEKVMALGVG